MSTTIPVNVPLVINAKKFFQLITKYSNPATPKKAEIVDNSIIKVNTKITKKGKIKITNLDNFLLYRIVKVFYFI